MAEIPFEVLMLALEATRGTAVTPPTHTLNLAGVIKPYISQYRPKEQRGTLAMNYRHKIVRKNCTWTGDNDADVNYLPVWLNMAVAPLTSPSTPTNGVLTRLWTFTRSMTADAIKAATMYWGDPAMNQLQSPFCVLEELVFENDATSEVVATLSVKGGGNFPTKVTPPAAPASIAGDTMPGLEMQLWVDTASAIGTTAITGRLLKAKHTITTGVTYKYIAGGPTTTFGFSAIGREPTVGLKTELEFEFSDFNQYDQWAAGTDLKVRVRHNGNLIESVTPDYYNYAQFDSYGPYEELDWGDNQGTNRTVKLVMNSQYDTTLASDFSVAVQNARTSL